MAVVLEIIDLLVCRKIHGCGCVADDPVPRKSVESIFCNVEITWPVVPPQDETSCTVPDYRKDLNHGGSI